MLKELCNLTYKALSVDSEFDYNAFHAEATPPYGGSMSCVRPARFPARRLE